MHLLTIIILAAGLTGVPAQPVEVLPKVVEAPVHDFTDYMAAGAGNFGPNSGGRGEFNPGYMGTPPSFKGKREAPVMDTDKPKTESQAKAGNQDVQARHEAPAGSTVDPTFKNIETRGYNHYGGHGYGGGGYGGYGGGGWGGGHGGYGGYGGGGWGGGHGGYGAYGDGDDYGGGHGGYGGYGGGGWGGGHGGHGGYGHGHGYHSSNYVSSSASGGDHNTAADDQKYRDNLAKLAANNCGEDCHHSLDSYRSVASKDSRLSKENHDNTYQSDYGHINTK
ncbi:hypothetical protein CGRA01v4_02069 [Colletotrichum graminicola]|uniref:Uncharacterized protein n=1 Tax=Colletotrichum graminicola (strain M1.001 / M2 / FGSC 10212) TaxID=645133 RepID=E3QRZ9_COLGM|nr:uncharacterized protein GLRG_08566 [Colletotrichum graminicola M1.001]EFQ33637.1 hypothetical protein GLRG_08566 [Colletotrichum graminicola M1.001]WDK10790.1 hypothetical protein CGRA01v4_02069 [Colletotrichum graminicola]